MKITGLSGQSHIAVGITTEKQLMFDGTAGDFFGALNNGAIINLKGSARRFVGDTMAVGGIILQGNAQRGVGHAMSGGIIVIRGTVNGDIGQLMRGGTIIVSGNCGPRSGAYMFNGDLIIASNAGEELGLNMVGGAIYIGGKPRSIGNNAQVVSLTIADESKLKKYFEHYGIKQEPSVFRKIVPISKNPWKDKVFDYNISPNSYASTGKETITEKPLTALEKAACEIMNKTKSSLLSATGPNNDEGTSYFDKLSILPTQTKPIKDLKLLDTSFELQVTIGDKLEAPLVLDVPFILSNRGAGVVSKSCKMAFAFAAAQVNTALDTPSGTYSEEVELIKKYNGKIIHSWDAARLTANANYLTQCSAVQIVLGTGGTGAMSTMIPAAKLNSELSIMWQIPEGIDVILPPKLFDFDVPADLKRHVDLLREITEFNLPILIKLAAGNIYDDTKLAVRAGADAIVIEGYDWCNQNSPTISANNLGVPAIAAIPQCVKALRDTRADKRGVKLLVAGGFRNGADIFKALALGADAAVINKAAEIAIGCDLCGKCNTNTCPAGVATTDPEREIKLDWVEAGQKLENYLITVTNELKLLLLLTGNSSISTIDSNLLRALDYHTAAVTGVPLAGFDKILPMWEH